MLRSTNAHGNRVGPVEGSAALSYGEKRRVSYVEVGRKVTKVK